MRGRGLKLISPAGAGFITVAPHAGAWIETNLHGVTSSMRLVAPHAGAWIETLIVTTHFSMSQVAPHAGAWIETINSSTLKSSA